MKVKRIVLFIVALFILSIIGSFIYTRFCLNEFKMNRNGSTLTIGNSSYTSSGYISSTDEENLGRTIGIAIKGKRTITDYIWPFWVMEYKNDKEHNHVFVRGLMGSGGTYIKDFK